MKIELEIGQRIEVVAESLVVIVNPTEEGFIIDVWPKNDATAEGLDEPLGTLAIEYSDADIAGEDE